jgi:hypothetical protein
MYYARHISSLKDRDGALTFDAKGEDPMDLRDEIIRAESRMHDGEG